MAKGKLLSYKNCIYSYGPRSGGFGTFIIISLSLLFSLLFLFIYFDSYILDYDTTCVLTSSTISCAVAFFHIFLPNVELVWFRDFSFLKIALYLVP